MSELSRKGLVKQRVLLHAMGDVFVGTNNDCDRYLKYYVKLLKLAGLYDELEQDLKDAMIIEEADART